MKLVYKPDNPPEFQFECEPHSDAHKAAIDAIRNWSDVASLVLFAENQHGYCNTNGMFGITYPGDLDEDELASSNRIPAGSVEAIAWYGGHDGESYLLSETDYLNLLHQFLTITKNDELASRIEPLLAKDP